MPRAGWKKPVSDRRLSDLVSVGVLTWVFPPDLVDEVIAAAGRTEQRNRSLPARVMAYFAIGMAMHSEGSYEDVLSQLTDGLAWSSGWAQNYSPPSKSVIFQARQRLGPEPMKALFERVAVPIGTQSTPGTWLAGRRLVAIDGLCLDVADTPENMESFGRPGVTRASSQRSRRLGWWLWRSAGRMRCSRRRSASTPSPKPPWRSDSLGRCSPGCCCSLTAGSFPSPCGAKQPAPGPSCCGGSGPTAPAPAPSTCRTYRMVPGWCT